MNEKPRDDLTVINGIGPVWQKRLQESLGVYTFQDLAAKASTEIITELESKGQPTPPDNELDSWVSQAQELVTARSSSAELETEQENVENSNPPISSEQWKTLGTFVVEYEFLEHMGAGKTEHLQVRINANQDETDNRIRWEEFVVAEPCQWMLEQIKIGEIAPTELKQLIEKSRTQSQEELKQEIATKRTEAQNILNKELAGKRTTATKMLDKQLIVERAQAKTALDKELAEKHTVATKELDKQINDERSKAKTTLDKGIANRRTTATKELDKQLYDDQAIAKTALDKEIADKRTAATKELDKQLNDERAKAKTALDKELTDKHTAASTELDKQLNDEREKAKAGLEEELLKMRMQVMLDLERKIEEGSLQPPQDNVPQEEEESQPQLDPEPEPQEITQPIVQEPAPGPVDLPFINLAITQFQVYQPLEAAEPLEIAQPGQSISNTLNSREGFTVGIDVELAEPAMPELADPGLTYYVQLFAQNRSTGSKIHLGDSAVAQFVEGLSLYSITLADIVLASGTYDLSAFVVIQDGRQIADYLKVPLIQVV